MDEPAKKLGLLMRERRNNMFHLTQQEMADSLNISLSYYKALERGKMLPATGVLFGILRKMNISLDSLISPNLIDENDQDSAYHELLRIINQCDSYQRSVLIATGNALINNPKQT